MRIRLYALFGCLFLVCLVIDVLSFGALVSEPGIGPPLAASARAQSPLAHTYMVLGAPVVDSIPELQTCGQAAAGAAFGDSYSAISARPEAAIELLFSESRGPLYALYVLFFWGAPLFLALTLAAWLLRTRHTHLIKGVRQ